jgi:hypothetical protein
MKKLLIYLMLTLPMLTFSQPHKQVMELEDVVVTIHDKNIKIESGTSEAKRLFLLISNEKDTLVNVTKTGKIKKEIKDFQPKKDGQMFVLQVRTYNEYGWRECSKFLWYYTIYFD